MNRKRFEENLLSVEKIRKKSRKKKNYEEIYEHRIAGMTFGAVWGINDKYVPFDRQRTLETIKDKMRPALILETPNQFCERCKILLVPGTSRNHDKHSKGELILKAKVPPEELTKTTWFLIHFKWFANQYQLEKKFSELTTETLNKLGNIVGNM